MRYLITGGGAVTGILWFLALSAAEGMRAGLFRTGTEEGVFPGIVLAVVASAVGITILLRMGTYFSAVVASVLLLCVVAGLFNFSLAVAAIQRVSFDLPVLFSRGAGSVSVWVTLTGVAAYAVFSYRSGVRADRAASVSGRQHHASAG